MRQEGPWALRRVGSQLPLGLDTILKPTSNVDPPPCRFGGGPSPEPGPPHELSSWQKDPTEESLSPELGPDCGLQKEWPRPAVLPLTPLTPPT